MELKERPRIGVMGASECPPRILELAREVGYLIGRRGGLLVCGGQGGVMEAACRGAKAAGGTTVGILPTSDRADANRYVDIAIPTGMGEARNALVVRAADVLIAVAGEFGTLSEIALALRSGTPVVGLETWSLAPPEGGQADIALARSPEEAVALAFRLAAGRP